MLCVAESVRFQFYETAAILKLHFAEKVLKIVSKIGRRYKAVSNQSYKPKKEALKMFKKLDEVPFTT